MGTLQIPEAIHQVEIRQILEATPPVEILQILEAIHLVEIRQILEATPPVEILQIKDLEATLLILVLQVTLLVLPLAILQVVLDTLPVLSLPCTRLVTRPPPTRGSPPTPPRSRGRR